MPNHGISVYFASVVPNIAVEEMFISKIGSLHIEAALLPVYSPKR